MYMFCMHCGGGFVIGLKKKKAEVTDGLTFTWCLMVTGMVASGY